MNTRCTGCQKEFPIGEITPARFARPAVADLIRVEYPKWDADSLVCHEDLNRFRSHTEQVAREPSWMTTEDDFREATKAENVKGDAYVVQQALAKAENSPQASPGTNAQSPALAGLCVTSRKTAKQSIGG